MSPVDPLTCEDVGCPCVKPRPTTISIGDQTFHVEEDGRVTEGSVNPHGVLSVGREGKGKEGKAPEMKILDVPPEEKLALLLTQWFPPTPTPADIEKMRGATRDMERSRNEWMNRHEAAEKRIKELETEPRKVSANARQMADVGPGLTEVKGTDMEMAERLAIELRLFKGYYDEAAKGLWVEIARREKLEAALKAVEWGRKGTCVKCDACRQVSSGHDSGCVVGEALSL